MSDTDIDIIKILYDNLKDMLEKDGLHTLGDLDFHLFDFKKLNDNLKAYYNNSKFFKFKEVYKTNKQIRFNPNSGEGYSSIVSSGTGSSFSIHDKILQMLLEQDSNIILIQEVLSSMDDSTDDKEKIKFLKTFIIIAKKLLKFRIPGESYIDLDLFKKNVTSFNKLAEEFNSLYPMKKLKIIDDSLSMAGGATSTMYGTDLDAKISKIMDDKKAEFKNFKFHFKKDETKRHVIKFNNNNWVLHKYPKLESEIVEVPFQDLYSMSDKEKIKFLYDNLKKLNYIIDFQNATNLHVFAIVLFNMIQPIYFDKIFPVNPADSLYKFNEKEYNDFLQEFIKPLNTQEYNGCIYASASIIKSFFIDNDLALFTLTDNMFSMTPVMNPINLNNLCHIYQSIDKSNIPVCNKYILGCILNTELTHNINPPANPINSSVWEKDLTKPTKVPTWQKCKDYLSESGFWENVKSDLRDTPPIIILAVLLVLKFKIKKGNCQDTDGKYFMEFETVESWLKDTLIQQLENEITDDDERNNAYKAIKDNAKLLELLNLYLEVVPHEFLNSKKTLDLCDKQRLNNLRRVPFNHRNTLDQRFAEFVARNRREVGLLVGGSIKNNNNKSIYFNALSHQLYNLNKLLNTNKAIQKGGNDVVNVEEGSDMHKAVKYLLDRDDTPSYATSIKGLVDTLNQIQDMTPDLSNKLQDIIQETEKHELQFAGIRTLLAHIISQNSDNKNITYDENSIRKLLNKFVKKKEATIEGTQKTLEILKTNYVPILKDIRGDLYIAWPF